MLTWFVSGSFLLDVLRTITQGLAKLGKVKVTMRSLVILALLAPAPFLAYAAEELPAPGATIMLKPTATGYQGQIVIPRGKYTDAQVKSTDPLINDNLDVRVDKEQDVLRPEGGAQKPPSRGGHPAALSPRAQAFVRLVTLVLKTGVLRQGQYPVTLRLKADTDEIRDLFITVPAARIEPIDTLIILREIGGGRISANQPQIWETERDWLTNITLTQRGNTDAGPVPAGRIRAKARIADIGPGGSGLIQLGRDYNLEGDFPLGTAKGKLTIAADQLADPISFNFEIRSRIWFWWIFAPMLAGLLLGRSARTWLTKVINLDREKEKTYTLLALIDSGLALNADAEFGTAAQAARAKAVDASQRGTVDEVKTATSEAQHDYEVAVTTLAGRRAELDKAISNFRALVQTPFRSPISISDALARARKDLTDGLDGIASNDVLKATQALNALLLEIQQAVTGETRTWIDAVEKLDPVVTCLEPISGADATADIAANLKSLRGAVSGPLAQVETPGVSVEMIKAALGALHGGIYALENLSNHFGTVLSTQLTRFSRILADAPLPDPGRWQAWMDAARRIATDIPQLPASDPEPAIAKLDDSASNLVAHLRDAIVGQVAEKAQVDQLDTLVKNGQIAAAITKLAELVQPRQEEALVEKGIVPPGGEPAPVTQPAPDVIMPRMVMTAAQARASDTVTPSPHAKRFHPWPSSPQ
jgi:hypothetical protein